MTRAGRCAEVIRLIVLGAFPVATTAITSAEVEQIVASGLVYNLEFEIPKPGPYQLRIAVLDANSERIGSATRFVEIPDFNRAGIALSSVQLRFRWQAQRRTHSSGSDRRPQSCDTGFRIGRSSGLRLHGVWGSDRTRKPKIDMTVRLVHGAEQIFQGEPILLPIPNEDSRMGVAATGKIRLPATLPTGDYALEFTVVDRLQNKRLATAAQWVDFTLVRPD